MTERPCHDSTRVEVGSTWERISQIENVYPANRAAVNASTSDSQMGVRVFESLCVLTSCERLFDANRAWWPPRFQSDLVQRVQGWFVPHSQWPV